MSTQKLNSQRQSHRQVSGLCKVAASVGLAVGMATLTGCEVDSWFDPSVIGRWEQTPTIVPILDRIASIEDETGVHVEATQIQPADLVPDAEEYRIAAGDVLEIRIRDFFEVRIEERFERVVDRTGFIDLPKLGAFKMEDKTPTQAREAIENAIADADMQDNPVVAVTPLQLRQQTFSVLGAVASPGQYYIPTRNYRILEGLTVAGGIAETIPKIYVIRQKSLTDGTTARTEPTRQTPGWNEPVKPGAGQPAGDDLMKLIDDLSKPERDSPSPAVLGSRPAVVAAARNQPPIDLPEGAANRPATPAQPEQPDRSRSNWIFLNGQWVRTDGTGVPEGDDPMSGTPGSGEAQVVQRVIEIPTAQLLAGKADVNVVLRPSDVVRVPPPATGLVYLTGQVSRPGPYNLPGDGRLTLLRAITSAGGLGVLAIPERVDLTRVVGDSRQATIRLNLRAIAEQTQPDIYLKPDDMINVGTNFFAYPIAIIRSGFRMSYGFGFILDRNFAGDIWGADLQQTGF